MHAATTSGANASDQDLGPLAWVLDELRKTLDNAVKALRRHVREVESGQADATAIANGTHLQLARQQLHMAVGALSMVGMREPAQVLGAMEDAAQKFVNQPELCTEPAVAKVEAASFALIDYLEGVLAGKSVSAVGLFPQYRAVRVLAGGGQAHPADLWAVSSKAAAVGGVAVVPPLAYAPEVRSQFDQGVLKIVKTGDPVSAKKLAQLSLGLASAQTAAPVRAFWMLATAYFEALGEGLIAADLYAKRIASRVLTQYAGLARGDTSLTPRLVQDMLFYAAQAVPTETSDTPILAAVRKAYSLHRHVPTNYEEQRFGRFDPALVAQARKRLAAAAETWSALAGGDLHRLKAAHDQFAQVGESLTKLHPESVELAHALNQAVNATARSNAAPPAALGMEVATSVLYLEAAYEELDQASAHMAERASLLAGRLERVLRGGQPEPLDAWMEELYHRVSDRQTMGSVVDELRSSLGDVEQALDQFFRAPREKVPLGRVSAQMSQMRGVLSVLGLGEASLAMARMRETVDRFMFDDAQDDAQRAVTFDKLGNSLGAMGFLIDMLAYQPALARKLFVYDEEAGEFKLVMGRNAAPTDAEQLVEDLGETWADAAPAPAVEAAVEPAHLPEAVLPVDDFADTVPPATEPTPEPVAEPVVGPEPVLDLDSELLAEPLAEPLAEAPAIAESVAATNVEPEAVAEFGLAVEPDTATVLLPEEVLQAEAEAPPVPPVPPVAEVAASPAPQVDDEDDDAELRDIFIDEAREVLETGLAAVSSLRETPANVAEQTVLRRAFHTLKGSSRMVGLSEFGEAGWAMEQLLNSWLASPSPANDDLLSLCEDALRGFAMWVEDLAIGAGDDWRAAPFRAAADALRLEGRREPLRIPQAAGTAGPVSMPLGTLEDTPAEEPTLEVVDDAVDGFDWGNVEEVEPAPEIPELPLPAEAELSDASDVLSEAELLAAFADTDVPAQPSAPDAPEETITEALTPTLEAEAEAEAEDAAAAEAVQAPAVAEPALPEEEATQDLVEVTPEALVADTVAAAVEAPAVSPPSAPELDVETESEGSDAIKAIGPLRIGIPLYNVFLNEADEWSRRLQTSLNEWALELHQPLSDTSVALAHSLAGSSATVGFQALSQLARALEDALLHVQMDGSGTEHQAQVFNDAAEDIRRLLHQFAAGFLKDANPAVVEALRELLAQGPTSVQDSLQDDEVAVSTFADTLDGGAEEETPSTPEPVAADAEAADEKAEKTEDLTAVKDAEETTLADAELAAELAPKVTAEAAAEPQILAPVFEMPVAPRLSQAAEARAATATDGFGDDIDAVDVIDADLFPIFEEEAAELLPQLGSALRQWRAHPDNAGARSEVLRALHTLKGSARLAGALRLGELAHRLETVIEYMGADGDPTAATIEPLLAHFDVLQGNMDALRTSHLQSVGGADVLPINASIEIRGAEDLETAAPLPAPLPQVTRQLAGQSVRVRSQLLDRMVNQAGEVIITRTRLDARVGQLRGSLNDLTGNLERLRQQLREIELQAESQMQSRLAQSKESEQGYDPLEFDRFTRVQELTRMMAESVNDVATVQRNLQRTIEGAEDDLAAQARQARELQRDLLRTRMVEFEGIAERLYAVVRQGSKDTGKQVKLDITGGAIEMDRGVLDRMAPAFEHLLRNAMAHGIETPEVRQAAGKPVAGTIHIGLHHEGNDISVTVGDDGAGLDLDRIRQRAEAQGLVTPGQVLEPGAVADLVFLPGFSTASQVSEISGRGIGMDVVRAEVQALGGRIETVTETGKGTRFKMVLPLTTAVTQVVMLRMGALSIGVPANLVETVRRTPQVELAQAYAQEALEYAGEQVSLYWGGSLLQTSARSTEDGGKHSPVVVLRSASQRIALHVDEVLGNQEVVVKNLGPQLSRLPGLAGMSVLASGAVVLIYNPVALATVYGPRARLWQAVQRSGAEQPVVAQGLGAGADVPLVLVVDDSITVRRVTQRLLKREGYRVALATDGVQALERLREERPALVLSDIEMPRMDGFDLAQTIRSDAALKDLPIVMISSRTADKHRERARALGVNHYLGKPYPEEALLELVRQYAAQAALAATEH